jgi:ATP-dependent DNA helicase PIF1
MPKAKKKVLSDEQKEVLDKVVDKQKSIFFTGCAGVGKSLLIEYMVSSLREKLGNEGQVVVTASTGRAAFNIRGSTLHSFAGIGLGKEDAATLARKVCFNNGLRHRWKKVKVLIIDEISMIDGRLFDKLEHVARQAREIDRPFGGIQLILSGDFLQLPPVSANVANEGYALRTFQAKTWSRCIDESICLRTIFRQSDPEFVVCLAKLRIGCMDDSTIKLLSGLARDLPPQDEGEPVNLYATRAKADRHNTERLLSIEGTEYVYECKDKVQPRSNSDILKQCPAPSTITLKKGAQVMLIRNLSADLVNGTVGIIVGFSNEIDRTHGGKTFKEALPIVRFTLANGRMYTRPIDRSTWEVTQPSGAFLASRCQMPLILAWAVTIHKSQGQTIQRLRVDLQDVFESGQVYVALSRATGVDNLQVIGLNPDSVKTDTESLTFYVDNDLL